MKQRLPPLRKGAVLVSIASRKKDFHRELGILDRTEPRNFNGEPGHDSLAVYLAHHSPREHPRH